MFNVKKLLLTTILTLIILITLPECKGSFDVQPRELYLSMDKEFINGNTSEKIILINTGDSEINISWYLDNPSPDLIRLNRTIIPNLNWIDLEPKWQTIQAYNNSEFFIYLNIPEDKNYLNKYWEIWITFKEEETGFIKFEHAVRFYIDTPKNLKEVNDNILTFSIIVFVVLIFIVFLSIIYFYKKKKKS